MKVIAAVLYVAIGIGAAIGVHVQSPGQDAYTKISVGIFWPVALGVTVGKVSKNDFGTSLCRKANQ